MRYWITTCFALLVGFHAGYSQKIDRKLENLLQREVANFGGDIGIYVQHFKKNKVASISADTIFPTASIVKVPILVGVFQQINQGKLQLKNTFSYDSARNYGGSGLMQFYKDKSPTDLSTLVSLMLTYSDNVASIWCQELAGGGATINPLMDSLGLTNTKVNSRTAGREALWKKYGWGQTTPREIALLLTKIRQQELFDARMSDKMYRFLKNQFYNERSLAQFPATIATASKTGSIDDARGEVVFVHAPSGDFVFSVLTKGNKDQRWTPDNEAEVLTRRIANLLWNYFEPKHPFTPYAPIR
ncbi:class A beta-lactamase-related serine hydrolase [Sphingobacterium oryzagri]|uniref:beta-lactamase n=1 Tax=Sphingobacterium oryzagri TaxID=3025669 RepID=A0ABY7WAV3_9SPHI|nr:serine hydrolase [Sphingobacterium sp. KACC 22765]WDF66768.1 class A beta-lactamase-related serine hydrolase [Sphingobacterium sp. KACC 22765]